MSGSSLESKQTRGSVNRGTEHRFQQITALWYKGLLCPHPSTAWEQTPRADTNAAITNSSLGAGPQQLRTSLWPGTAHSKEKIPGIKKERKIPTHIALSWGKFKAIQQRQDGVVWSGLTEHTLKILELLFCRAVAISVAGSTAQCPERASWHYCVTHGYGIIQHA